MIKIGGSNTMAQSGQAVATDGQITTIERRVGPSKDGNSVSSHSTVLATVRGVLVGNRQLQENMNAAIEVNNLKPEIDATFHFNDLRKAYTFFQSGQHYGRVVVDFG